MIKKYRIWRQGDQFPYENCKGWVESSSGTHCFSDYYLFQDDGCVVEFVGANESKEDWVQRTIKPSYIPQQYIGKKDINNREIYEGDIIEYTEVFEGDGYKYRGVVLYDNEFSSWGLASKIDKSTGFLDYLFSNTVRDLKIIGNYLEHPEIYDKIDEFNRCLSNNI